LPFAFVLQLRAPSFSFAAHFASTCLNGSHQANHGAGSAVVEPLNVMLFALNELMNSGQLAPNMEGQPPAWIVPPTTDREPNPPFGYVVSFIRHHERGFCNILDV
jgi:hypothetical protein